MRYVLINNITKQIKSLGSHSEYKLLENGDQNIELVDNLQGLTKNKLKWDGKNIIPKTKEELENEEKMKIQQELLNKFKPLIDAMTFQEISIQKGANISNAIFTDDDIKNWGDYIAEIANGNIEAVMPEIPIGYKNITG